MTTTEQIAEAIEAALTSDGRLTIVTAEVWLTEGAVVGRYDGRAVFDNRATLVRVEKVTAQRVQTSNGETYNRDGSPTSRGRRDSLVPLTDLDWRRWWERAQLKDATFKIGQLSRSDGPRSAEALRQEIARILAGAVAVVDNPLLAWNAD